MSLQVWLPLTRDLRQQGLSTGSITSNNASFDTNGKLGGCYVFSGVDNAIGVGNLSTMTTTDFTFTCWFYHDDTWSSKSWETIFGGPSGFELQAKNSTTNSPVIYLYSWGKGNFAYELNKWNHLAMVRTASETKVYLNGELKITGSTGSIPNGNYFVGSWRDATSQNFKGKMCDIRIYDNALSSQEVKEISKGLVLHYPLSDGNIESTYNYLENKSFSNYGSYGFGSKGTISVTTEVEPPIAGNEVALVTSSATTAGNGAVEIATSIYPGTNMNKDDTFTVTAYVKGKGATIGKRVHIHLYNTNGTNTQSTGKDYTFTNEWQRIEYTLKWNYDTPSNSSLNCYVVGYIAPQEQFYVSSIQVEKKDHSTPFTADTRTSTTIYDTSGYCNNGTITGDLTTSTDTPKYKVSTAITASNSKITSPRLFSKTQPLTSDYTVALWAKLDSNATQISRIYNGVCALNFQPSGPYISYSYSTSSNSTTGSSKKITTDVWLHMAMVYSQTDATITIYFDGKKHYTYTNKPTVYACEAQETLFGSNPPGLVSDVRVYATALSADDVLSLYQNEAAFDEKGNILGPIR